MAGQLLTFHLPNSGTPTSIDQVVSDFDNVTFHISTPESKSKILISIALRCFQDLLRYGAQQVLEREYGSLIVQPEQGYDFSILVDVEDLPPTAGKLLRPVYILLQG